MPRPKPVLVLVVLVLGGCTSVSSSSPGPSRSAAGASPTLPPVATPQPTDATVATAPPQEIPSQTDTAWGRIWDELPVGFPTGGLGPSVQVEPHDAAASGASDLSASVADLAVAMQAALEGANFSTLSMSGPFEDGSVIIESDGPPETPDCLVQTTIAPLGAGSRMTILYGAACPFPLE